jgi:DNA-binding LacI/PurR family transcriptional regulator
MPTTPQKATKMADIARLAGVSMSTASRALQNSSLISAETRERVQAIALKHNYRSNVLARNLRLSQSNSIALVLPIDPATEAIWTNPFVLKFFGAVGSILSKYDYDVLVSQANFNSSQFDSRYYNSGMVAGFITLGRGMDDTHLNEMAANGVPLVVWGPIVTGQQYCSVGIDNIAIARETTEYLIGLGRRRIAIITGDLDYKHSEGYLRYLGYEEALGTAGIPVDSTLVTNASFSGESGYLAMKHLLQVAPDLDAVFVAYSDVVAIAALQALGDAGKSVPEHVSVVGFDNIDVSAFTNPPLTTVSQGLHRGGANLLVEKLLQQISGEKVSSTMLNGKLIIRKSCSAITP